MNNSKRKALCCDNCGKGLRLTREGDEVFWAHEDGRVVCG